MPEHAVTLVLVVQGTKCRVVWQHQVLGGADWCLFVSGCGVHSIDNCVVFGKHCKLSAVASRAVVVLSNTSRFNG